MLRVLLLKDWFWSFDLFDLFLTLALSRERLSMKLVKYFLKVFQAA
jgi:hypothetical protein